MNTLAILRVPKSVIQTSTLNEPGYIDTAIELEGGGYLATIEVFHQLHCLVSILLTVWRSIPINDLWKCRTW